MISTSTLTCLEFSETQVEYRIPIIERVLEAGFAYENENERHLTLSPVLEHGAMSIA